MTFTSKALIASLTIAAAIMKRESEKKKKGKKKKRRRRRSSSKGGRRGSAVALQGASCVCGCSLFLCATRGGKAICGRP